MAAASTVSTPAEVWVNATTPLLEVTDVEVAYGEARALFGVSLSVAQGSVTAILGANGAGPVTRPVHKHAVGEGHPAQAHG